MANPRFLLFYYISSMKTEILSDYYTTCAH